MTVDTTRGSMVSRSVRLHEDTLNRLEQVAKESDPPKGVTVLMREIIEKYLAEPDQFQHIGEPYELQGHFTY